MVSHAGSGAEIVRIGDQFLASLNHEIRTPLSGIVGMVDLLMETELTDEQRDYVATARLCAEQLMEMLNAALEYAALSAQPVRLEKAEFRLADAVGAVVRDLLPKAEAKGLKIGYRAAGGLPEYVCGDARRLRQALAPLVANAIKFTARGEVEVTVSAPGAWNGVAKVEIAVRDTGVGIPPEKLEAVFDPFRQMETGLSRSHSGMGLGLAVARRLAEIMGGSITAESQPGAGSTFRLTLPLEVPSAGGREAAAGRGAEVEEQRRPRILVVDDNEVARRVVTHILGQAGYWLECAVGGEEAVRAASSRRYDLILMDMQMPGVNGLEATAAIRRLPGYGATPVLALTANCSEEFARTCRAAGCAEFLSKPIQRGELVDAVRRHLK